MQEAYIVAGFRTAVTKSKRGGFRFTRPDDLAIDVIKGLLASVPQLDPLRVDDVIVGNALSPEAEQGLQVGRIIAARAVGIHAAGITINRYCASGYGEYCHGNGKDQDRNGRMYHCRGSREYEPCTNSRLENSTRLFYSCG